MKQPKLSNKELRHIGVLHPDILITISREANLLLKRKKVEKLKLLEAIKGMLHSQNYALWQNSPLEALSQIVKDLMSSHPSLPKDIQGVGSYNLKPESIQYTIYGENIIEKEAIDQMETSMRLPIAQMGALMPDAHKGYGLPIGGVLATSENTIIPYAVGVDIACRMCMSVFPIKPDQIDAQRKSLKTLLGNHTVFGVGSKNKMHHNPKVFDRQEWNETKFIRQHRDLAYSQLGTSGAGNHFVEWGTLKVLIDEPKVNLKQGDYIALLSHSGSRGFGNEVASYYSKIAMSKVHLPKEAKHLAWLDLSTQEGQEYWIAMNLAGHYASANHNEIHSKISKEFGIQPFSKIENHHNFAWKEKISNGKIAVVHRKGATPAGKGVVGIIPGSMTHPGFIVRGRGNSLSINSASHGAGRSMSRNQALKSFGWSDLQNALVKNGVELIGGDIDEIPMAYKDIETVMQLQTDLVEVIAIFHPKIVRMAEADRRR